MADDATLLSAAFEAFAERGYEGTAIRDIARRLNVSHNLIHFRFGSKEELWRKAVDHAFGRSAVEVYPAFDETFDTTRDQLRSLLVGFALYSWRHPAVIGLMNLEGRRASWRLEYIYRTYVSPFQARLEEMLDAIALKTGARRAPTSTFMVMLVHGAGNYFALRPLMELAGRGVAEDEATVARLAEEFVDLLLPALEIRDPVEASPGAAEDGDEPRPNRAGTG